MFWFEHANTRKHVSEHSWLSGWVILSIWAYLAHLPCAFSLILNRINKLMFWFKHANTRKHVSEQSWLSGWIILNILAHLAHLAQFYFSLIFSAINTYNFSWLNLTNEKISVSEDKSLVESGQSLRHLSWRRKSPLLVGNFCSKLWSTLVYFRQKQGYIHFSPLRPRRVGTGQERKKQQPTDGPPCKFEENYHFQPESLIRITMAKKKKKKSELLVC